MDEIYIYILIYIYVELEVTVLRIMNLYTKMTWLLYIIISTIESKLKSHTQLLKSK